MSMTNFPDHPEIARCLCSGYARPIKFPSCPECDHVTDTFCKRNGEVIGCDNCVKSADAWEEMDEES